MREPRRAESHLTEPVPLPAAPEEVLGGDEHVLEMDLAVVAGPGHRLDVADDLEPLGRQVDDERRVARLRRHGVRIGARDDDREVRAARAGREPLVSVR